MTHVAPKEETREKTVEGLPLSNARDWRTAALPPPPPARSPELWQGEGFLAAFVLANGERLRRGHKGRTGERFWICITHGSSPSLGQSNDWAQMTEKAHGQNPERKQESRAGIGNEWSKCLRQQCARLMGQAQPIEEVWIAKAYYYYLGSLG